MTTPDTSVLAAELDSIVSWADYEEMNIEATAENIVNSEWLAAHDAQMRTAVLEEVSAMISKAHMDALFVHPDTRNLPPEGMFRRGISMFSGKIMETIRTM